MTKRRDLLKGAGLVAAATASVSFAKAGDALPREHRLAIQVSENRAEIMTLALNNAANVSKAFADQGVDVAIEIVAYGPGLHMLRTDTSPVKERIASFPKSMPNVAFSACANTMHGMEKAEGKPVQLIGEARIVEAGVVRLMELQELGWSYIKV